MHTSQTTFKAALTRVSGNVKTGPIPTSMTGKQTCPDACPLKAKGCYAAGGPTNIHWKKVTEGERGKDWDSFCEDVASLPRGQLWRHNVAGDLPGDGKQIDANLLSRLIRANKGKRGFTYTHYNVKDFWNADVIRSANYNGFTINLSANNTKEADELAALQIAPVVCILPLDAENVTYTPAGRKVVACPAEKSDKVSCATCQLCQHASREYIIGFRAHGVSKKTVDIIARG
jgi:hypothetical protein